MPPKSNLPTYSFERASERAILPSLRGCSTRESRLVLGKRQRSDTRPSNRLETPHLLEQQETAAQIANVQDQKADSGATYFNRQPVFNAGLTKSNLQSFQTTASLELPEALDEASLVFQQEPKIFS